MQHAPWRLILTLLAVLFARPVWAINGADLAFQSFGAVGGTPTDWDLNENGYVGTYVTLAAPGEVTIAVNAAGQAAGGADSRMNIVIGDQSAPFDVTADFNNYMHTFSLPAGTHFVRTQYTNDFVSNTIPAAGRKLTVRALNVTGATEVNDNTDALALAAADTYIQYGRRGPARVQLYGATPGALVEVKLKQHAFNWGANMHGTSAALLSNTQYTDFFKSHFNMVVPSRAGKWNNNESTRDTVTGVVEGGYVDAMLDFAEANNMGARMHTLIWGNSTSAQEQPAWAVTMLQQPNNIDSATGLTNASALRGEISERIDYYVGDGPGGQADLSLRYSEVDVYNESVHTGSQAAGSSDYWTRFGGAAGIAPIYDEVAQAVADSGSSAKIYVNEYNVLQNGFDEYGNWYRNHIEAHQNADGDPTDGPVSGIGMQLYAVGGHSASYMQQVLQNMSVTGLPQTITEFGVQETVTDPGEAKDFVDLSLRMAFGAPDMTTFMYWGFWASATSNLQRASALTNADWSLTEIGKMYEDMLGIQNWDADPNDGWTTHIASLPVGPDGAIDFTGFYGLYDIKIGATTYTLDLTKGTTDYGLIVGPPWADFDLDGDQDGADFLAWQRGFGTGTNAAFTLGDANFDHEIDADDLAMWIAQYGEAAVSAAHSTPEPPSAYMAALALTAAATAARRLARSLRLSAFA
jgi:GH35 family endo-1,4-beta-xylanase